MKTFDQFVLEATDETREEQHTKSRLDSRGRKFRRKGASTSFNRAMKALQTGDTERHRYWLTKAYKSLTGQTEQED
jgi:hypothetical protein